MSATCVVFVDTLYQHKNQPTFVKFDRGEKLIHTFVMLLCDVKIIGMETKILLFVYLGLQSLLVFKTRFMSLSSKFYIFWFVNISY